eukprot:21467-Heterococcus_DN1.PRE.5
MRTAATCMCCAVHIVKYTQYSATMYTTACCKGNDQHCGMLPHSCMFYIPTDVIVHTEGQACAVRASHTLAYELRTARAMTAAYGAMYIAHFNLMLIEITTVVPAVARLAVGGSFLLVVEPTMISAVILGLGSFTQHAVQASVGQQYPSSSLSSPGSTSGSS